MSRLDANQTLQGAYDDSSSTFKMTIVNKFVPPQYDYVALVQPDAATDTFTFKTGGSTGTTVATITITYTDSTHATMVNATRT